MCCIPTCVELISQSCQLLLIYKKTSNERLLCDDKISKALCVLACDNIIIATIILASSPESYSKGSKEDEVNCE